MARKLLACLAALLVFVLAGPFTAAHGSSSAQAGDTVQPAPGTVEVDPAVSSAVLSAVREAQDVLPPMRYAAITAVTVADGWQMVSVAGLTGLRLDGSWRLAEDGAWFGLVILRRDAAGVWSGAAEGTQAYHSLLALAPASVLSSQARADLDSGPRLAATVPRLRFPWQSGTRMVYGSLAVHDSGFAGWVTGWKAVDFLSDGDVARGHAPNRLLTSAAGTIGAVCKDPYSVAIRMDAGGVPQLLYLHLMDNARLQTGVSFAIGEELGQLRTGSFNANCGWGSQDAGWFHVHYAFPAASGSLQLEDWRLDLTDKLWHSGTLTRAPGDWLTASPITLTAPLLLEPAAGAVEGAGYNLRFTWDAVPDATAYQVEWAGGSYTSTLPLGWFAGQSYEVGPIDPGDYTWRVRARNGSLIGPWSATQTFTIREIHLTFGQRAYLPALLQPPELP